MTNMAASCEQILQQNYPNLDTTVADYVVGVLNGAGDDFGSTADVYEAIGDMLLASDLDTGEHQVQKLCARFYKILKNSDTYEQDTVKILDTPMNLASLAAVPTAAESMPEEKNIWIAKRENPSSVNMKKLEKAEAKIKEKQEKRSKNEYAPPKTNGVQEMACASQQSNRRFNKLEASGTNKSYDIRIENFDVSYGDKVLLKCATINLAFGRRYGLCGRNGLGKTTLLRMLSSGNLQIAAHLSVLHVEQEVVGDDTLAVQSVLECDTKREGLLKEERTISANISDGAADPNLNTRLSEVYAQLEAIDSDRAPARAAVILAGLGFSPEMQRMTTKEFSGGWRMRLALARALFSKPDLLLLDEPTNMLDMKAIIWLEEYLQQWSTTILVVSHDRQFLNTIVTDVIHLSQQLLDHYKGDFEMFMKTRADKLKNQQKEFEAQKQYRDHIQVFIDRFRYNANRASQVQSKLKLLEKLPELIPIEKETAVQLRLPEVDKLSPPILQLDEICFHYHKDKPIFHNICVNANMESRICIVGENGAGKTTLLKVLLGDLTPTSGIRHVHRNLKIGYFSQHHVDQLGMNLSCVEVLQKKVPGKPVEYYRGHLGAFGVSGDLALRPVDSLSGGQKSRVAFAQMCINNPNFFILDEPTNHLDMETIEALGRAINKFQGGVLLVSHDERLIRVVCSELWVCKDGTVRSLEGGIDEYKKLVHEELAAQNKL